jgi:UDP-N-acetylglucosamine--N-acetylmuramyl-(pentapeptide) pyrophosphoryl-undecaprenol N-acetylglucosamine transferase
MRVLIAAGGTGGHIYPGIAVAQEIKRRDSNSAVQFVGTERGLEKKLVPQAGFELKFIDIAGLKNVSLAARMRGLAMLPTSILAAGKLIREFRPDVVVGAGGYVSGPVLLSAALMKRPTMVMESNALPGWTNRMAARFVDRAAVSFEQALPFFRGKAVVTGNPVRRQFFEIPPKHRDSGRFSLLVFGGSQGARAINNAMIEALPQLKSSPVPLRIRHQTGVADLERVKAAYEKAGWNDYTAEVTVYIDNMVQEFGAADLIVCRAGATTTAELIAAGKASLMIPFPYAADDHQRKNAEAMRDSGAARMILERDLSASRLATEIVELATRPDAVDAMESASKLMARGDAAAAAVDMIEELAGISSRSTRQGQEERRDQ